tara:strand:+ start:1179 stop:1514 length:336 start_codon:yes stop_codon:yes gene_type:complete
MITSYYNTTKETVKELNVSKAKAYTQEEYIMDIFFFFKDKGGTKMTPSEICSIFCEEYKDVPLTSIRRAINTLTNKGKLIKTDIMRQGIYGKPEHCWKLSDEGDRQMKLTL